MVDRSPDNTDYFVRQLMKHRKRIYAFILTLVGNSSDADDIMQDTAALMWQKYHQSEEIMDFAALGLQIAHFKVLEFRKKLTHFTINELSYQYLNAYFADSRAAPREDQLPSISLISQRSFSICSTRAP